MLKMNDFAQSKKQTCKLRSVPSSDVHVIANLYLIANTYHYNNVYTIDGAIITQLCSYMF